MFSSWPLIGHSRNGQYAYILKLYADYFSNAENTMKTISTSLHVQKIHTLSHNDFFHCYKVYNILKELILFTNSGCNLP